MSISSANRLNAISVMSLAFRDTWPVLSSSMSFFLGLVLASVLSTALIAWSNPSEVIAVSSGLAYMIATFGGMFAIVPGAFRNSGGSFEMDRFRLTFYLLVSGLVLFFGLFSHNVFGSVVWGFLPIFFIFSTSSFPAAWQIVKKNIIATVVVSACTIVLIENVTRWLIGGGILAAAWLSGAIPELIQSGSRSFGHNVLAEIAASIQCVGFLILYSFVALIQVYSIHYLHDRPSSASLK